MRVIKTGALLATTVMALGGLAVDRELVRPNDPVEVKLIIASPGNALYAGVGHAALRVTCPARKVDLCYTYESEAVSYRVLSFLAGRLKMGMYVVNAEEYFDLYRQDGRGLRQYPLSLPHDVTMRLGQHLDALTAEGIVLPYDYLRRGCALSIFNQLLHATPPAVLSLPKWNERFREDTRREVFVAGLDNVPWYRFVLMAILGWELDWSVPPTQKVLLPEDLVAVLRETKINGQTVLTGDGTVLSEARFVVRPSRFTPLHATLLLLLLAVVRLFWKNRLIDTVFLSIYAIGGVFFTYMAFVSRLPVSGWHWMVIPFNVLPLFFYRWRAKWGLGYAVLALLWMGAMALWPHDLIDGSYYPLVLSFAVFFAAEKCALRRH